jgi:eukaryotic-like serine/threonine-protein kinase
MSLDRDIAAWLETLAVDTADTLRSAPRSTILPTQVRASTRGRQALALLEELIGQSPAAAAQLRLGSTIGQGGMGVIRLAEQLALGRTVAIKTLRPDRRDPGSALDLLREAWVTGSLEHPNIVPVHYLGLDDDRQPLLVLKRIEGTEWSELIGDPDAVAARTGATDLLAWNLGILMQVCNALRFAHSRGILHRDVKPSNVMIGAFGEVYLLDWGIAVSVRDDGTGRLPLASEATELAGTPCYMAPEMLGREPRVPLTERTDVYLAGACLFEIIAGRTPHEGDSAVAVIASVVASRPELPPGVPPELGRICLRALAADPADRFESIEALQAAVQGYLEHRGSARLAAQARDRLDELLAVLTGTTEREVIYRLFGACRFGFREALTTWPDNQDARDGLVRATIAVAEHELAADDPRAAIGLLSELDPPPEELIARARAAAAAKAVRLAALERLGAQHDPRIGTRTRMFIALILGTLFTVFPLLSYVTGVELRTHRDLTLWSIGFMVVVITLGAWARESMSKTVVNRRMLGTAMFLFVAQIVLAIGAWNLELSMAQTQIAQLFLWFVLSGMMAIAVDRGIAPTSIAMAAAFLVAARYPDHRLLAMSAGNLVFTINAVWRWFPETLRWTDEERAHHRPPRR